MDEFEEFQRVGRGHLNAGKGKAFGGADDDSAGGRVVVAVAAFREGDALDEAAPADRQQDQFVGHEADPQRAAAHPPAGVEPGARVEIECIAVFP